MTGRLWTASPQQAKSICQPGNQLHLLLLYVAYGWLLLSGTLHFAIDVVGQYARGKRSPGPQHALLRSELRLRMSQVLFAALALLAISQGLIILAVAWAESGLSGSFELAGDMCPFLEYRQPRMTLDCLRPFSLQRPLRNEQQNN